MVPRARSKRWSIGPQILGCLLAVALAACGAADAPGIQTQFSDSAGVTIAESLGFPELGAGGWALDPTPTLTIGTLDGDSLYQLFRVTGSVELSDGRIAVTDNGTRQLRIFAPDGTFLASFGREGEGPGEFRNIQVMGTVGSDTLVVLDSRQRRTSRFHPDLGFLGQAVLPEEAGVAMHSNGMFGDGSIVFGGGVNFGAGGEAPENGYERLTNPYYSVALDGSGITHFGEFPGTEVVWTTGSIDGRESLAAAFVQFGKSPRAMARGDRLALGTRDRYEINVFDPSGGLVRIIRVQNSPVAVTDTHLDGLLEEALARLPSPDLAPQIRAGFRDIPHADYMPAFEAILLDSEGHLWVEDYNVPGDTLRTWTVFDEGGVPVTRLSLSTDNRVLDIGRDYVLAVFEDDLGVEYVRSYPLTRGG
jgi:hypothetical protein